MYIGRVKRLFIWFFIAAILSSGVLAMSASPQKAKAIGTANDIASCSAITPFEANNNNEGIVFNNFKISADGKSINQTITFNKQGGVSKTYNFSFSNYQISLGNYTYNYTSQDYSGAVLTLTSKTTLENREFTAKISNFNSGDNLFQSYAKVFNEYYDYRGFNLLQCVHPDLFGNGNYDTKIDFHGENPPTIRIGASANRPATIFQLTSPVLSKGGGAPDDRIFIFQYLKNEGGTIDSQFKRYSVKLLAQGNNAFLAECDDIGTYDSCYDYSGKKVNLSNVMLFWNHVFNSKNTSGGDNKCGAVTKYVSADPSNPENDKDLADWTSEPEITCLNASPDGWLAKWGITVKGVSITNPSGEDDTCGVTGNWTALALAKVLCVILKSLGGAAKWLINTIFKTVFDAYNFPKEQHLVQSLSVTINPFAIQKASAAINEPSESSIKKALDGDPPWIVNSWKIILGLADVFVVVVLLFLAITNILHIQYDTYAIKKSLPTLIFGIILANFSIFITKMLVDATNALTVTFMGSSAGDGVNSLITAVVPEAGAPSFMTANSIWTLIVAIFFAFFAIIAFMILGFLFYIRYIVILTLTIAAPLAFVLMAFPPTQGIFKQWWGWYAKFIFMKPISLFFIWLATEVLKGSENKVGITVWAVVVFLVCAAIIVPFKLGGFIMQGWGALGKKGVRLAGKGAGYAAAITMARLGNRWANTRFGRWQAGRQQEIETLGKERETIMAKHKREIDKKAGGKYALRRKEMASEEQLGKTQEADFQQKMREGTLNTLSRRALKKYAGVKSATELKDKYATIEDKLDSAERALKKRTEWNLAVSGMRNMDKHEKLLARIKDKVVTSLDGQDLDYDVSRTTLSTLRNELMTVGDDKVKRQAIEEKIDQLEKGIATFETAQTKLDPSINFDNYLDKNHYGRMQARINPMLADEMDAILKSETTDQIFDALEGGGGTGESRFNKEDVKNYLTGQVDKVSIPARYGIQAYLMSSQMKIRTAGGIDQQNAVSRAVRLMENKSPGAKQQLIKDIKEQMNPEAVRAVNDELQRTVGKTIDEIDASDITSLDISRMGSRARDFVRRLSVGVQQHYSMGAAGSPGRYVGRGANSTLAQDIMSRSTDDLAKRALGGAIALTGTTPEIEVLKGAERAMNQIHDSGADQVIDSLATDVIAKVKPPQVTIDDDAVRRQIIAIISQFSGQNLADLNSQLNQINPQLSIQFDETQFPEIKRLASRVGTGLDNMDGLARLAITETCLPHYNNRVRELTTDETVVVQSDIEALSNEMQTRLSEGGNLSEDTAITGHFNSILRFFGHTKIEREEMIRHLDDFPESAIDLVRKKGFVVEAARRLKKEYQEVVKTAAEDQRPIPRNFEEDNRRVNETVRQVVNETFEGPQPQPPTPPAAGAPPQAAGQPETPESQPYGEDRPKSIP